MTTKEKEPATVGAVASSSSCLMQQKKSTNSITFNFKNVKQAEFVLLAVRKHIKEREELLVSLNNMSAEKGGRYDRIVERWTADTDLLKDAAMKLEEVCVYG